MKNVAGFWAAACLLAVPALGRAQTSVAADWTSSGNDNALTRGDSANSVTSFFSFMNSQVARLGAGHLLVVTEPKPARADDSEASALAAARRRAVIRIVTGYEP